MSSIIKINNYEEGILGKAKKCMSYCPFQTITPTAVFFIFLKIIHPKWEKMKGKTLKSSKRKI